LTTNENSLQEYCKTLTKVIKEVEHIHYNEEILESDNVKVVWKIVKKKRGKYTTEEVTPSIKIKENVIKSPKLMANSFSTSYQL
jgi:hypothetical protein